MALSTRQNNFTWSKWFWRDFRNDLAGVSYAATGLWINMLGAMFEANPRGILGGSPAEVSRALGIPPAAIESHAEHITPLLEELETAGVFSRGQDIDFRLPADSIINRRMFRDWCLSMTRSEVGTRGGHAGLGTPKTRDLAKANESKPKAKQHHVPQSIITSCAESAKANQKHASSNTLEARSYIELNLNESNLRDTSKSTPRASLKAALTRLSDTLATVTPTAPPDADLAAWIQDVYELTHDMTLTASPHADRIAQILGHPYGARHLKDLLEHAQSDKVRNPAAFVNAGLARIHADLGLADIAQEQTHV